MALGYEEIRSVLDGEDLPIAFVDIDAFDRNLERHVAIVRPRGTPLRVATKSVRVVALLRRLLDRGGDALRGLMCWASAEAEHLAGHGFDDLLVAYPPFRRGDVTRLARLVAGGKRVSVVADCSAAIARFAEVGREHGVDLPVVLCTDMALHLLGGRAVVGVRRSPLRTPEQVVELARVVADTRGVSFRGVLAYEAQIAGLGDDSPSPQVYRSAAGLATPLATLAADRAQNAIKRLLKRASVADVARRRAAMVEALRDAGLVPEIVNGGGTGSLDTTTPETGVTEVTAGSGFFKPHLFDHYSNPHMRALEPAAFFAVEVTRTPGPGLVTCLGGGYVASGAAGRDKVPLPWLPRGLELLGMEMCGEVQTPLRVPADVSLDLGDPVVFRHAKAGELCERFSTVALISGGAIVDRVPTYRGEGRCFF